MHIDVFTGSGGPGSSPGEERELRDLLGKLALRGVEAELIGRESVGPEGSPVVEPPGQDLPGTRSPASVRRAEALLLAGLHADTPLGDAELSRWLERARAATAAGRPVVVSGLALDAGTVPGETVRGLFSVASLVGLRDEASLAVARRLCPDHPALRVGGGDAPLPVRTAAPARRPEHEGPEHECPEHEGSERDGPGREEPDDGQGPDAATEPPRIVAVVGRRPAGPFSPEEAAPVLAAVLDALVHRTGGVVTLLACGGTPPDAEFAADVAALLRDDIRGEAADTDGAVLRADYVLTTCARGAALGLAAGAVVLPVGPDKYAVERMNGVLGRWGLADGVVPLAALLTPGDAAWDTRAAVQQWAAEAVEHRGAVRAALADAEPAVQEAAARWWDGVAGVLRGERPPDVPGTAVPARGPGAPVVRALRRRYTVPEIPSERPTVAVVLRHRELPVRLRRAVDDLLAQTFTDWRLVVVNDGGDPAEVDEALAPSRAELAGRETVLHHRRALGPAAAANRGLRAGDSELVVLHDGNGRWEPTVLQRGVARLEDPLVADDGVVVRAPGAGSGQEAPPGLLGCGPVGPAREALTLTDVLDGDRTALEAPFLYRRAVHGVLGDYDETLGAAVDWEFVLRFLETFTAGLLPVRRGRAGGHSAARDEPVVRDRRLRQWTSEHGTGLPLYLRRAAAEEAAGLHRRLDAAEGLSRELLAVVRAQSQQLERLERAVAEKGFRAFWRRAWRSLRGG